MPKLNCWDFMDCRRNNPDRFVDGKNTCPAATEAFAQGINGGENGGRACWAIAGTLSRDGIQGFHAGNVRSCLECEFYKSIKKEEDKNFVTGSDLVQMLLEK